VTVVVASVHHTGTNFVFQELLKGLKQIGMAYSKHYRPPDNAFTRIHCDMQQSPYLHWWVSRFPTIVPLRHPASVAVSWKAREKSMWALENQWEILREMVAPYNPIYLPIDVDDRQSWLDKLNERLGMNIQTDWPVIMSRKQTATLEDEELASVGRVMADGFFTQFGYGD
jgi:hypothetical protein